MTFYSQCQLLWLSLFVIDCTGTHYAHSRRFSPEVLKLSLGKPKGCLWGSAVGTKGEGAEWSPASTTSPNHIYVSDVHDPEFHEKGTDLCWMDSKPAVCLAATVFVLF